MKQIMGKFKCTASNEVGGAKKVELKPLPSQVPEDANYGWSQLAQAEGKIELTISNPRAHSIIRPGTNYKVTIEEDV